MNLNKKKLKKTEKSERSKMKTVLLLTAILLASSLISCANLQNGFDPSIGMKSLRYYMQHLNRLRKEQSKLERLIASERHKNEGFNEGLSRMLDRNILGQ